MSTEHLFLTFTNLTDSSRHQEYNAWHQLDHLPENMLLPGVTWGDRWVRPSDCAATSHVGDAVFAPTQYAVAYGFRAPVADSVAAWTDLNQRALWWGRRPELAWTNRSPAGFFHPVKGYAAERVLVDPDALPLRPHRGIHLTLSRLAEPGSADAVASMAEYDRERIPALLALPGVAGAWTFRCAGAAGGFGAAAPRDDSGLVLRLLYCDEDPVVTGQLVEDADPGWIGRDTVAGDPEHVLFSSALGSITPWEWDWFGQS